MESLKAGRPLSPQASFDMETFEDVVELVKWAEIEKRYPV